MVCEGDAAFLCELCRVLQEIHQYLRDTVGICLHGEILTFGDECQLHIRFQFEAYLVDASLADTGDVCNGLCGYIPFAIQIGEVEYIIDELQEVGAVLLDDVGILFRVVIIAEVAAEYL